MKQCFILSTAFCFVVLSYSDVKLILEIVLNAAHHWWRWSTTVATYRLPEIFSIIFFKRLYSRLIQLMGHALYPRMSGQGCPTGSYVSALMPWPVIQKLLFCQTPWVCVSLADCDPVVLLKEATGNRSHPP